MTVKQHSAAFFLWSMCSLLGCGGNYSNGDIEYQTSVPQAEDLTPNIGAQLLANSAETFRLTYGTVSSYRALLRFVGTLLDHVRQHPATRRFPDARVWGPFADREHKGFAVKVTIKRGGTAMAPQFAYSIDFAATSNQVFIPVIFGSFDPQGGVGEGNGNVAWDFAALRSTGFPTDADTQDIVRIDMVHSRQGGSRTLEVHQTNTAAAENERWDLTYEEAPDRSARTSFTVAIANNLWSQEVDVISAWRADGAGRGELKVTAGLAAGLGGVDCWGPSTVATFVSRDWDQAANAGDPNSCVLPSLR